MWIGTLNNPDTTTMEEFIKAWVDIAGAVYATGQLEKGANGTPHIQYFVQYKDKKRLGTLKKQCSKSNFTGINLNNGADNYCNKEDTRVEGPWTFGIRPAKLNKTGDLARRNKELIEMGAKRAIDEGHVKIEKLKSLMQSLDAYTLLSPPIAAIEGPLQHEWHWGVSGSGKSHNTRTKYPDAYLKGRNVWWDGYTNQETVIIEEMAPDKICASHMKDWADKWSFIAQVKGSSVKIRPIRILVTSNYSIQECYPKP